jgi:hypothetical protein
MTGGRPTLASISARENGNRASTFRAAEERFLSQHSIACATAEGSALGTLPAKRAGEFPQATVRQLRATSRLIEKSTYRWELRGGELTGTTSDKSHEYAVGFYAFAAGTQNWKVAPGPSFDTADKRPP